VPAAETEKDGRRAKGASKTCSVPGRAASRPATATADRADHAPRWRSSTPSVRPPARWLTGCRRVCGRFPRQRPSTSMNKNVTTPEGAAAAGGADTPAESHNRRTVTGGLVNRALHVLGPRQDQLGVTPMLGYAEQKRPGWKRQPGRFFNCGCALGNAERASFHSTL
jgi:hypothetical protein